jgi:transcriptional regulator with XRE-family HTH domain
VWVAADDVDVRAIGVVVETRRRVFGWSRHELSQRSGVSLSQLRRLEQGESSTLGVAVFVRLARALEMTPDELLRYSGVRTGTSSYGELRDYVDGLSLAGREALAKIAGALMDLEGSWAGTRGDTTPDPPE